MPTACMGRMDIQIDAINMSIDVPASLKVQLACLALSAGTMRHLLSIALPVLVTSVCFATYINDAYQGK